MNAVPPSPPGLGHRPQLPIQPLVAETYRLLWSQRDELVRLGLTPVLVSFLLAVVADDGTGSGAPNLLQLLNLLPLTIFAVNWHRLVLLGPQATAGGLGVRWERRETRFLLQSLLLSFGIGIVLTIPFAMAVQLLQQSPLTYAAMMAVLLAGLFLWLRLGLIFPAIAIDHPYRLAQSWSDTAGCGIQFVIAVLAAALPIFLALLIFMEFAFSMGLDRAAPYAMLFLISAGSYLPTTAGFTVIALAFRQLSGWSGQPGPVLVSRG